MEKLKAIQDQIKETDNKLSDLRAQERAELERLAFEKYGVKVGCLVRDRKKVDHRITRMDLRWTKPWLTGDPRKKDGTFGTAERNIYDDWTLVKE